MHHITPEFHDDMYEDVRFDGFQFLVWMMFRDSAKTALARAMMVWWIVYKKKMNIAWIGFDERKAAKNARAIAKELQVNHKIIEDFGQLYYEPTGGAKQSKPKKITEYLCSNDVYFRASSTAITNRGDLEAEFRPDAYVIDDFENDKTKGSILKTKAVIEYIGETITGLAADCSVLFLCNYITKYGSVAYLRNRAKGNTNWRVREQKLIEKGRIVWPDKFVQTRREAFEINSKQPNKKKWVKSIEQMKEDAGTARFNQENLNIPESESGSMVKEEWYLNGRNRYSKNDIMIDDQEENYFWQTEDGMFKGEVYTGIDPAISKKETSDDRAIVTVVKFTIPGVEMNRKYYLIFEEKAGKWGMKDFAINLRATQKKFMPRRTAVENVGVQEAFRELFTMYDISTEAISPDGDKVRRMSANVADLEFGKVLFPDDGSCDDLKQELIDFNGEDGRPDNRVDAFNYAMQLAKLGGSGEFHEADDGGTETSGLMDQTF